jgi:hypothetical protein
VIYLTPIVISIQPTVAQMAVHLKLVVVVAVVAPEVVGLHTSIVELLLHLKVLQNTLQIMELSGATVVLAVTLEVLVMLEVVIKRVISLLDLQLVLVAPLE